MLNSVPRLVTSWEKPIVVARHGTYDQYAAKDIEIPPTFAGSVKLVTQDSATGETLEFPLAHDFKAGEGGVAMAMFNTAPSIEGFADATFNFALGRKMPLYLSTKDTILRKYDGLFRRTFQRRYEETFRARFEAAGIWYEHRLIDDMVAFAMKNEGGFVWACKNYDGDVQSVRPLSALPPTCYSLTHTHRTPSPRALARLAS